MVEDFDNIPPTRADCFQVKLALFQAKKVCVGRFC